MIDPQGPEAQDAREQGEYDARQDDAAQRALDPNWEPDDEIPDDVRYWSAPQVEPSPVDDLPLRSSDVEPF